LTTQTLDLSQPSQTGFLNWKDATCSQHIEIGEFLTLGRDCGNHVVLEDEFASSRHARIERKAYGFCFRDLRSRNGSLINGARVVEAILRDGDRIRLGRTELLFSARRFAEQEDYHLTSKNVYWQQQLDRVPDIAQAPFPVLLTGPSGSGKDVLAQTIHRLSTRKGGPFVSVNCSALSESLVESELFGHVKGGFTGAVADRKGAFEAARGGTLFLDEIGDLPLALQPKLLRALENRQIRPVGSDRCVETDVRIVAATHHDLQRLVREEGFRSDLYFRLNVIQLKMPALRDRKEDFDDLFYAFARAVRVRFTFDAVRKLKSHDWPGNIRELKNAVARAKAYWGEREVTEDDVTQLMDGQPGVDGETNPRPRRSVIRELELEMIKGRLIANRGNQRRTATDLGMPRSTLHDRIRSYGLDINKLMRVD
jgi:DNA-binding NtrC family response regulator